MTTEAIIKQVFHVKEGAAVPDMDKIALAMKLFASAKCEDQRRICQFEYETAYETNTGTTENDELSQMYKLKGLRYCQAPSLE